MGYEADFKVKDGFIGRHDSEVVNVKEKQELAYWARAIQVTEDELVGLVEAVGPSLQAIMRAVILKDIRKRGFNAGK